MNATPAVLKVTWRPPLKTTPDDHKGCEAYCEELKQLVWKADRRIAQLEGELQDEREKWARLRAATQDASRQGYLVDVPSFMRGIEQEVPRVR